MKLDDEYQQAMNESDNRPAGEDTEFEVLPEGYYLCEVDSIKLSDKAGPSGYKQWVVVWRVVRPKASAKRTIWDRRSLSPKAAFKMRELFDALGYEYGSDSDELVGERAVVEIEHQEIERGPRTGQLSENVVALYSSEDEDYLRLVGK